MLHNMGIVAQQSWAKLGVCFCLFFSLVEHPSVTGWNSHLCIHQGGGTPEPLGKGSFVSVAKPRCGITDGLLHWGLLFGKYLALLKSNLLLCAAFTKREIHSLHKQLSGTIKENGRIICVKANTWGTDTLRAIDPSVWMTVAPATSTPL